MFNAAAFAQMKQARGASPSGAGRPARSAPGAPPVGPVSPDEQKAHEDAKRFARLVVSEIKLYNESKVNEGRRNKDIYERLKEDIERGRQMYADRVPAAVRDSTNYFFDELVRILAGGDAGALARCSSIVPVALPLTSLALVVLLSAAAPRPPTASPRSHALRKSRPSARRSLAARPAPAAAAAEALRRVAEAHPGTPASGLARMAAGLALLNAQKARESLALLDPPGRAADAHRPTTRSSRPAGHRKSLQQWKDAAHSYLAAASTGTTPVACSALPRAAEAFAKAGRPDSPLSSRFERTAGECLPASAAGAPAARRDPEARGDRAGRRPGLRSTRPRLPGFDGSPRQARAAAGWRSPRSCPPSPRKSARPRYLRKGQTLLDAGPPPDAAAAFRACPAGGARQQSEADLRARASRACPVAAAWRLPRPRSCCARFPPSSPHAAEAAYQLARIRYRRGRLDGRLRGGGPEVPGHARGPRKRCSRWPTSYQKDARDAEALPYWRRMLEQLPGGPVRGARGAGVSAWADYRAGRYELAASVLEKTARVRPPSHATPGFLYWAGRARAAQGRVGSRAAALRRDRAALPAMRTTACARGRRSARLPPGPPSSASPSLLAARPGARERAPGDPGRARPAAPAHRPARSSPGRAPAAAPLAPRRRPRSPGSTGGAAGSAPRSSP